MLLTYRQAVRVCVGSLRAGRAVSWRVATVPAFSVPSLPVVRAAPPVRCPQRSCNSAFLYCSRLIFPGAAGFMLPVGQGVPYARCRAPLPDPATLL